jgi:hypothetical protein|tara:strand:- start:2819 stop:3415 length:597 start_codon:yes stop_codon:yes gene_type:complete
MDDNNIDIVVGKLRKPVRKTPAKVRRSTYTESSAETIKPILDKLINDPTDVFVPCADTGYTASTLFVKINDALLWFIDNSKDEEESDDYRMLRAQIATRMIMDSENPGVLVYFKTGMRKLRMKSNEAKALDFVQTDSSRWRHDVTRWLESAQPNDMFTSDVLDSDLTEDDERWLHETLSSVAPEAEIVVKGNSFRIIR